jgi:hypothetical protein
MRRYLGIALFLLLCTSAFGRQKAQGNCEQGGKTITTSGLSSTQKVQQSFPSCTVTVYQAGTLVLATIYSDNAGTPLANPFTAAALDGRWGFYADSGRYDVQLSSSGIVTPFTLGDVPIGMDALTGSTTGTGSVIVLQTSPTLITPILGVAAATSLTSNSIALGGGTPLTTTNQSGTGSIAMTNSPVLVTPAIGVATGTSLALGGGTPLATTNQSGTGSIAMTNSPAFVTPSLGVAAATSLAINGGTAITGQTGTGGTVAMSNAPALVAPVITGAATAAQLSINGGTAINAQTGTGSVVAMQTSPAFVTPSLGVASATSLAATGKITGGGLVENVAPNATWGLDGAQANTLITIANNATYDLAAGLAWSQ